MQKTINMEKKKYYNIETLSTCGAKITIHPKVVNEFFKDEFNKWANDKSENEHFIFNIIPVFMTQKEFRELPDFEF